MRQHILALALAVAMAATLDAQGQSGQDNGNNGRREESSVHLGPRPFFLINDMEDSRLKRRLEQCSAGPFEKSNFSIGHRGAALQFPEHTLESYEAGARMGAGILECDVTFTSDKQLVCRHAQNDLHTTTNILEIPELAAKCSRPFTPADPARGTSADARCCTSDLTVAEFKRLRGKMANNHQVNSVQAQAYSCTLHYLRAVEAIGLARAKASGLEAIETMKRLPTDDDAHGPGLVRADGRKIHPTYLFQAKAPAESKGPWDYLKLVATTPAEQAFRPIADGGYPFVKA